MWTKAFWKAATERMVRGAAVSVFGAFFVGDKMFDAMNIHTWDQVGSLAIGGAFGSLLLALIGGTVGSGDGPSFTGQEALTNPPEGV